MAAGETDTNKLDQYTDNDNNQSMTALPATDEPMQDPSVEW
jgi:hypothetical protein